MLRPIAFVSSLAAASVEGASQLRTVQTAFDLNNPDLLKELPIQTLIPGSPPSTGALSVDSSVKFQEMLGFGGAFTEASALNWKSMSPEDQAKMVKLYFADPSEGGHGYTMGRVPMGSSDFSLASYNFDNSSADSDLKFFDNNVTHDEANGMLPLMRAAQDAVQKRGQQLKIFASPWSPPAWMKLPVNGKQTMTGSATPLGLDSQYQRAWANYFSSFITAYRNKGVELWGVTPQNEPEYAANWDACVYTPEFEAQFVREHLGPVLHKEQPGVKIIGFDHNKDHVVQWAKVLYGDNDTKQYFDGIGVHWYGGLNTQHLDATHAIAPDKFILATEACNCGGVVYQNDTVKWWSRAEKLAIDILEDIKWWSAGWTDWNLVLNTAGGPNHANNLCDANIIADPEQTLGRGTMIMQASYYFMGQFSRFIPAGSHRILLNNTVKVDSKLGPQSVANKLLQFTPCSSNPAQTWHYDSTSKTLSVHGVDGMCAELDTSGTGEHIVMKPCVNGSVTQQWTVTVDGNPTMGQFTNDQSHACLTSLQVPGATIGLDPGVDGQAGFAQSCTSAQHLLRDDPRSQTYQSFELQGEGGSIFPEAFHIQTPLGDCMLPVGLDDVVFDAAAFLTPDGQISIVAMNLGNTTLGFDIYDAAAKGSYNVQLPPHAIATYLVDGPSNSSESEHEIIV